MSEESTTPIPDSASPEVQPAVDSPDTAITAETSPEVSPSPARPFTLQLPANLRVLFHLPPQGRGYTGKINNLFFFTDSLGRFDKVGTHQWDGGMHVFDGKLLTVEEFLSPRTQKYLADDSLAIRPLVKVVMLPDGTEPATVATPPAISMEELKALVAEIDRTRQLLSERQARVDELEAENSTYKAAIDRIEAEKSEQDVAGDVTQPQEPAPKEKPAKSKK